MKIRQGLVSNSSSCSFSIYGFAATDEKLFDLMSQTEKGRKALQEGADKYFDGNLEMIRKSREAAEYLPHVEHGNPEWDKKRYFGRDLYDMGRDETRGEFEARVEGEVREWLGEEAATQCSVYSDSWYNG